MSCVSAPRLGGKGLSKAICFDRRALFLGSGSGFILPRKRRSDESTAHSASMRCIVARIGLGAARNCDGPGPASTSHGGCPRGCRPPSRRLWAVGRGRRSTRRMVSVLLQLNAGGVTRFEVGPTAAVVAADTPRRSRLLSGEGAERGGRFEEPANLAWWRPLWGVSARVGAGRGPLRPSGLRGLARPNGATDLPGALFGETSLAAVSSGACRASGRRPGGPFGRAVSVVLTRPNVVRV